MTLISIMYIEDGIIVSLETVLSKIRSCQNEETLTTRALSAFCSVATLFDASLVVPMVDLIFDESLIVLIAAAIAKIFASVSRESSATFQERFFSTFGTAFFRNFEFIARSVISREPFSA